MQFVTPRFRPGSLLMFWFLFLLTIAIWIGMIATAQAQEDPEVKVDVYKEESTCNPVLERWAGAQLVELRVSPETLAAQAAYIKVIDEERALLLILIRKTCEGPWKAVAAKPLRVAKPAPKCESTDGSQCL